MYKFIYVSNFATTIGEKSCVCVCVCVCVCEGAFVNTYNRGLLFEYTLTNRGLTPVVSCPRLY